jgi:hypothetical protein
MPGRPAPARTSDFPPNALFERILSMADNPQGFGPYFRWEKPPGDTKLSPLRANVHALIGAVSSKMLQLDYIYDNLPSPADTPAKKTAVRMALKDLEGFTLVKALACPWACSPGDQTTELREWMLRSLQQHSEREDPGCTTDACWSSQELFDDVRDKHNLNDMDYPDSRMRQSLQALCDDLCVQNCPGDATIGFAPLRAKA